MKSPTPRSCTGASPACPTARTPAGQARDPRSAPGTPAIRRCCWARRAGTAAAPARPARAGACRQKTGSPSEPAVAVARQRAPERAIYVDSCPRTHPSPACGPRRPARSRSARAGAWRPPLDARVLRVRERLREVYGIPRMKPARPPDRRARPHRPLPVTNDRNRDVAYLRLRERLPTWDGRARRARRRDRAGDPPRRHLQGQVRAHQGDPAGRRRALREDPTREPSLDWLPEVPLAEARDYLVSLPGVGRKTAACVLLFAYGLRDVPVDTHVSRVGARLALLREGAPFAELHDQMLALTPPGHELELHVNLLRHGRRTCHARRPACGDCALARMCPSRGLFG